MTEVSIEYTDAFIPWFQSVAAMDGFLWAELNGVLVAGSTTVPVALAPAQTGNTVADIEQFVIDNLTAMTGDAPVGWVYPSGLPLFGWATDSFGPGNTQKNRPFVAIGSRFDYTYGLLNIPVRQELGTPDVLKWFIRIDAMPGSSTEVSPAWNDLETYRAAHGDQNPVLIVMELNPE